MSRDWPYACAPAPLEKILKTGESWLRDAELPGADRDARILMAEAAGIPRDRLSLHRQDVLGPDRIGDFYTMVLARAERKPVSKILGRRAFWDRDFWVTSAVLDPRPETETLVALALEQPFSDLLDLGTGSGILAVTLLAETAGTTGIATDISAEALKVAARNARRHGVADRLRLEACDWFAGVGGQYDLIVSNPPYIAAAEMPGLDPEVRDHDPHIALTDGADGLCAYRKIAAGAGGHLRPGGRLMVEIGAGQGAAVAAILRNAGLQQVRRHPDLDRRDRVVSAIRAP